MYRRKMGFSILLEECLCGPPKASRAPLCSHSAGGVGLFEMNFLKRMCDAHAQGVRNNSAPLWPLLMFAAFLEDNGVCIR